MPMMSPDDVLRSWRESEPAAEEADPQKYVAARAFAHRAVALGLVEPNPDIVALGLIVALTALTKYINANPKDAVAALRRSLQLQQPEATASIVEAALVMHKRLVCPPDAPLRERLFAHLSCAQEGCGRTTTARVVEVHDEEELRVDIASVAGKGWVAKQEGTKFYCAIHSGVGPQERCMRCGGAL